MKLLNHNTHVRLLMWLSRHIPARAQVLVCLL